MDKYACRVGVNGCMDVYGWWVGAYVYILCCLCLSMVSMDEWLCMSVCVYILCS